MIAVLDILQSIPVLSFLPPVLLAMIALVPHHQLGIELGVILLIFTGQVWNLAFSFYSSMKAIPREMLEASRIYRYSGVAALLAARNALRRHRPRVELDHLRGKWLVRADGLRDVSTEGTNFQLPGLGSYIQTATYSGDMRALLERDSHDRSDRRCDRPADLATADRVEREIQVRTGGGGRSRHFSDSHPAATFRLCRRRFRAASGRASKSRFTDGLPGSASAALCSQSIQMESNAKAPSAYWVVGIARSPLSSRGERSQCALMLRQVTLTDLRCCWRARLRLSFA